MTVYDALVIGAGQAGLAAGYYLQQAGATFQILEAGEDPGGSWPLFYDSLRLNTPARYSALPGLPFPGRPDRYPARDEVVDYLRAYRLAFGLPVRTRMRVRQIEHRGGLFRVRAGERPLLAHTVVAATGFFGNPHRPRIEGQERYRGRVLHEAEYRRPEPFRGQRVVIVGGGNGAVQIGVELAGLARVTLATRSPLRLMPQRLLGLDIHTWLRATGLDRSQWLGQRTSPAYATPAERAALAAGSPDRRPMFARFSEDGVVWADGTHERVDAVLFATGYRPSLAYLAGLGALAEDGTALQRDGASTSVPGLYFVGLPRQRTAASATLRGVGPDARVVVRQLQRYLLKQQARERASLARLRHSFALGCA